MALASMRGLQMFITDIRNCQSKDQERYRVEKELNKIRMKFSYEKSLSSYDKRKYVCKLLYIYMLGYQLDFGYREVLSLIGSTKYPEKQVGYMASGCLLHENNDSLNFIIKSVRLDIIGRNETYQCLALTMIGNIGGKAFAEEFAPEVQKIVVSSSCRPLVRKKAVLCLLHMYRKCPQAIQADVWPDYMGSLLDERDLGVLITAVTLLMELASKDPHPYFNCVSKCVRILERLLRNQSVPQDYTFYGIPSPWLQVKTIQVLQILPVSEDPQSTHTLLQLLERVVNGTDITPSINRTNVMHAVLFEAMALVIQLDVQKTVVPRCMSSLEKYICTRDSNIRCLGMEMMCRMLTVADMRDSVKIYESDILIALRDLDRSIQKVSVDLLYEICDATNVKRIVEELLQYFPSADFDIQENIAAKAGLLAEKYATDCSWYVDVILELVEKGGGLVPDDIWRGLLECVAKHDDIQVYAATRAREYISKPTVHEAMLKISGSLLGDNSHLVAQKPGYSPKEVFGLLHDKFPNVSTPTKAVLLAAYIKLLLNTIPADQELQKEVLPIFEKYGEYLDVDVQQHANACFSLNSNSPHVRPMPEPERKVSTQKSPGAGTSTRQIEVDLLGDLISMGQETVDTSSNPLLSLEMPFSEDPFSEDPFSALVTQPSITVQPTGNIGEWFKALCTKDNGILYEDLYVQIGIKARWQGPRGEMNMYVGNKQSEILTLVRASIVPEPHLKLDFTGLPNTIKASEQMPAVIKVTCLYAGRTVPSLHFSYVVSGNTVSVKLRLPIVISKFFQKTALSPSDFFASWRALAVAPNKLQEVVRGLQYASVSELAHAMNNLHIGVATGLDPNPNNVVAASTFHSETGGALLCMVRIETDPADKTQLRLTVASPNARLAMELKEYIKEQLLPDQLTSLTTSTVVKQDSISINPVDKPGSIRPQTGVSASPTAPNIAVTQSFPQAAANQKPGTLPRSLTQNAAASSDPLADLANLTITASKPALNPPINQPIALTNHAVNQAVTGSPLNQPDEGLVNNPFAVALSTSDTPVQPPPSSFDFEDLL